MIILGINAYHGDASAVLLRDSEPLAAVEATWCRPVVRASRRVGWDVHA